MRPLVLATSWLAGLLVLIALAAYAVFTLNQIGEEPIDPGGQASTSAEVIARGAYLARIAGCASCHTRQGGTPYAGGRAIETPFGAVFAGNLTPDAATGLGNWSPDAFWRALHNGRSLDGRLLYPAFPYTDYTRVTREDSDAIFSYLRTLAAVAQGTPAPTLRFPYNSQAALALWRALYFRPDRRAALEHAGAPPSRGAYLVDALGHCGACHTPRDALGGLRGDAPLGGAIVPGAHWWAPSLASNAEAGLADWPMADVVALLTTGVSSQASVAGPMAEVVYTSLQYLTPADAEAMASHLRSLPQVARKQGVVGSAATSVLERGAEVYRAHCAECHGDKGEGKPGAFPALADNRAVRMAEPLNLIQGVLQGGYQPATRGNPRPHGMPPFRHSLSEADVAAVLSYIRGAWGNGAGRVDIIDVHRAREYAGS